MQHARRHQQRQRARKGNTVINLLLGIMIAALPLTALVIEWLGDTGLSERHHGHHDTYLVPRSMTATLVLMMVFVGALGDVAGWLCHVGVFSADPTIVFAFFLMFLSVSLAMWAGIRRYRVVTYADHMCVTPFAGWTKTLVYAQVTRMVWTHRSFVTSYRNLRVYAGEKSAFLWGTIDLEQVLARINRFDVLEGSNPNLR